MAKGLTLKAILALDAKQFQQGIGKIQKQISSIGTAMKQAFTIGSVAMFGKSLIEYTKNYEDAMARVKAVSNATRGEFEMMNNEALRLGATTRYTATQVAETLEVLTRNGFNAQKATKSLAATLQLAQSQAINLADAGNMITNSLNMFGLSVNEVQRVNDVMASIASNTATNVEDFYDALVNAAPMAHALGISIEETAAALGSLAQRGIKGADAGTQLRMALQKMVDPSAMKKMKALGIEIDEEIIKAEGLSGILKKLNEANLSVSQLNEIFTVRSSKSILQLVRAVDDFNSILEITKNSSGTAFRMFEEGVGSLRKELDILKSVWENFLINLGNETSGVLKFAIRTLQDFISALNSGFGRAFNIATIAIVMYNKSIVNFIGYVRDAIVQRLAFGRAIKASASGEAAAVTASNAQISASEKQKAATATAAEAQTSNAMKKTAATATVAKSAFAGLYGVLISVAAILINKIVTYLMSVNSELRQAKRTMKEVGKTISNSKTQMSSIIALIGDGENPNTVNGAIKRACELFPEFADAITKAHMAASKIKNYEKLKQTLKEISALQETIKRQEAYEGMLNAAKAKLGKTLVASSRGKNSLRPGLALNYQKYATEIFKQSQKAGYSKEGADYILQRIADVIIDNVKKPWYEIGDMVLAELKDFGVSVDAKTTGKLVQEVLKGQKTGAFGIYKSNGVSDAQKASEAYKISTENAEKQTTDITWKTELDNFLADWRQIAFDYRDNNKEMQRAMGERVKEFADAVGGLNLTKEQRDELKSYQQRFPYKEEKTSASIGDAGSGSSKKTEWEKFTETLDEYPKKVNELDNQLHNHAITQAEYDKEIVKLNIDTWKAIAAIDKLDEKMKSLSKERVDTINTVKANVPQDADVANAYSELVNALHDFDKKKIEIINKNEQNAYADPSEYMDALMDLEDETYKNIASLKGLDKAVELLNEPLKNLYSDVTEAGKANKDYAEKLKKLETPNTLPPRFEGRDAQDIINKRDQYADVVNLLNEYEKQRLKLDMQRSKKAITDEQYDKNLATLNGVVGISLGQFRHLNEITSKLPQSLKNLYDEISNFKLPETDNIEPVDENSFISVLDNYYEKSLRLLEQKVNGSLDDTEYEKELQKLAKETIKNIANFDQLDKTVGFLPKKYQDVYYALVKLKEKIENTDVNVGDNTGNTTPKTPTVPEAAPTVEVNPVVNVTVNIDGEEVGKNVNVTVDTEKDETENKDLIDEIKKWQKAVEKANKSRQQIEIEEEVGTEKIEIQLELKQDEIERIQKRIQEIMSSGEVGKDGITILTENAMKELNELMAQLKKAMNDAETLGEMKTLASGIVQLQSGMDDFAKTAIDNISNVASAFDRLMSAIESIASAFGQELEWEGLKRVMSVVNGTIQIMEALRSIIVTVQAVQDIATKKKVANASKEVIANAAVTASEETKASAEASEAVAGAGSSVASIPYVGAALAIAAIAAITAALLAGMGKFENGGILQGSSSHGDKNVYRGNRGEMVINKAQQGALYRAIAEGRLGGGGPVEFVIRGDQLIGVLKNHNRKWN